MRKNYLENITNWSIMMSNIEIHFQTLRRRSILDKQVWGIWQTSLRYLKCGLALSFVFDVSSQSNLKAEKNGQIYANRPFPNYLKRLSQASVDAHPFIWSEAPAWAASCHLFSETKSTVSGFQKNVVLQNWTPPKNNWGKNHTPLPNFCLKNVPPPPSWGGHNSLRPSLDRFFDLFLFNISFFFSLVYCLYYFTLFKILKFSCLCLWMKLLSFFRCN